MFWFRDYFGFGSSIWVFKERHGWNQEIGDKRSKSQHQKNWKVISIAISEKGIAIYRRLWLFLNSRDRQLLIALKIDSRNYLSDSVSECSTNNASLNYIFQWPIMQNRVKNRTLSEKKWNPTALQDTVHTEHAIAIVDIHCSYGTCNNDSRYSLFIRNMQ